MRALVLHEYGRRPHVQDVADPRAGVGQITVSVVAAGLNPGDLADASGLLELTPLPKVLGREAVVEIDGRPWYVEDTVQPHGSFAEKTIIEQRDATPLPADIEPASALTLGRSGLAGWIPLETVAALAPGETVIVLGATGAVGQVAVRAAKLLGAARVVAAGRDLTSLTRLMAGGADRVAVIGGTTNEDAAALVDASDGGADVVIDLLWGSALVAALHATRAGGRIVSLGQSANDPIAPIPAPAFFGKTLLSYSNRTIPREVKRAAFERMLRHTASGEIAVDTRRVPLERALEAWRDQRQAPHLKLVLCP